MVITLKVSFFNDKENKAKISVSSVTEHAAPVMVMALEYSAWRVVKVILKNCSADI